MTPAIRADPALDGLAPLPPEPAAAIHGLAAAAGLLATLAADAGIPALCQSFASELRTVFGADHVAIGTIQLESRRRETIGFSSSVLEPGCLPAELPIEDVAAYAAAIEGDAQCIPDLAPLVLNPGTDIARAAGLRALIRAPFTLSDGRVGLVSVASLQPGRYTVADANLLRDLCRPLGLAIDRATLMARAATDRAALQDQAARLQRVNEFLSRLNAGGTPAELAASFAHECRQLFDAGHVIVMTFDVEARVARPLAVDSDVVTLAEAPPAGLPIEQAHSSILARDPTPTVTIDVREDGSRSWIHDRLFEHGMFSALRVPLRTDSLLGAISVWGAGTGHFSEDDAEVLGGIARPFALALEKAAALESLAASEAKYRSLVAQAQEMIIVVDSESHRIVDANLFAASQLGHSPGGLQGLLFSDLAPGAAATLNAHFRAESDGVSLLEQQFLRADGLALEVEMTAAAVTYGGRPAILTIARNTSDRRALLRERMQAQKMESLGKMAGSVAHDFNNLLTAILGFAGLLRYSAGLEGEDRENLVLIEDAAKRAAELTRRLLSFARGGQSQFGPVDLVPVIRDTVRLLEPALLPLIPVSVELPSAPVVIEGDRSQVEQAITNIVLNARDAMPAGGHIRIALGTSAGSAVLTIADDGPGMPEETRSRIFEPFFTTKVGSGTGLGMAITYGVVQGHHGEITVDSAPGTGTTFAITLPLRDAPA
ncbi:MAG: PAS domain S-box protein [Chloroflexi bacterium]|nr:PAS domain S-box protein [Chloroflexota bacterium]